MNFRGSLAIGLGLAMVPLFASSAEAFGSHRTKGHTVACYQKIRQPDQYAYVNQRVLVQSAHQTVRVTAAVYGIRRRSIVATPGWWETRAAAAAYATHRERVLVQPARTAWRTIPATYRTVSETRVIRPASVRWEHRNGGLFHRNHKLCKVVVPAETATFSRKVLVNPARRVATTQPAIYQWVERRVPMQPARSSRIYHKPVHRVVEEQYVATPARRHVVRQPAVYRTVRKRVLVRRGGYAWVRARSGC